MVRLKVSMHLSSPVCHSDINYSVSLLALLSQDHCFLEHTFLIPEQFTVKAHPALFEVEGRGKRHCYSSLQLTYTFKTRTKQARKAQPKDSIIYIYILHLQYSLQLTYTFKTRTKHKNCEGSHCAFSFDVALYKP